MEILSDSNEDICTDKPNPGSYEWWYFDAISLDGEYSLVAIFYHGNPFSRRYADALAGGRLDTAEFYPAISLSLYRKNEPIFYSFEEVLPDEATFSSVKPEGRVKKNRFVREESGTRLVYRLKLDQQLPGGDRLDGELTFSSSGKLYGEELFKKESEPEEEKHRWNLVQPSSDVKGVIRLRGYEDREIEFSGFGYHDHNAGMEPMKQSFTDWYWGRFHFSGHTFVYYLMNENKEQNHRAWLFDADQGATELSGAIELDDMGLNFFGIRSARKISGRSDGVEFLIQKTDVIDDGPFYQRFKSRLMLNLDGKIHQAVGISEYIHPGRISLKVFRPLVNMRIQYPGDPHWVQKNPRLYRWTW